MQTSSGESVAGLHNKSDGIAALLARHGLDPQLAPRFAALVELIARDPLAPTTITDPPKILSDHLADSLAALELPEVSGARLIADLGSGAGFPGLPLAMALPSSQVWLVEATRRKCQFIARAAEASQTANAHVVPARAEELPAQASAPGFPPPDLDLACARALAPLPVVAEYAAPLLRVGGTVLVWRGRRDAEEEEALTRAARELGLQVGEVHHMSPYPGAAERHLHILRKALATPPRFPRRPGAALRRPLGAT